LFCSRQYLVWDGGDEQFEARRVLI
jgi:hypothetical protein